MNIIETYVENGIQVKVLKGVEFKPRPKRTVQRKSTWASSVDVSRLYAWVKAAGAKNKRRAMLSEITGIDLSRVRGMIATPEQATKMTAYECELLLDAMKKIQKMEDSP